MVSLVKSLTILKLRYVSVNWVMRRKMRREYIDVEDSSFLFFIYYDLNILFMSLLLSKIKNL